MVTSELGAGALCAECAKGFHAPFDRFEQVAAIPDGPGRLQRCRRCGALWLEDLRSARRIDDDEAGALFGYAGAARSMA